MGNFSKVEERREEKEGERKKKREKGRKRGQKKGKKEKRKKKRQNKNRGMMNKKNDFGKLFQTGQGKASKSMEQYTVYTSKKKIAFTKYE